MAHIDRVEGKKRTVSGTRACMRLRSEGLVPANVYGHKQDPDNIMMEAESARALVFSGSKVVDLDLEGDVHKVLVRDVQWDTYSKHLMHIDFLRVDPNERLKADVPVQVRGIAPGVLAGGILEQPLHHVTVECLAVQLPDFLIVRVGSLQMGQAVHVGEMTDIPQGVNVVTPADQVLIHVVAPKAEKVADVAAPAAEATPAG